MPSKLPLLIVYLGHSNPTVLCISGGKKAPQVEFKNPARSNARMPIIFSRCGDSKLEGASQISPIKSDEKVSLIQSQFSLHKHQP